MDLLKSGTGLDYPPTPYYPEGLDGVGYLDNIYNFDFGGFYEWIIQKEAWAWSVYTLPLDGQADNTPPPHRFWGITIFEEQGIGAPTARCITDKDESFHPLMDIACEAICQIYNCPFDVFSIHVNGQTAGQKANVHVDTSDALVIMLTPNWKEEYEGGLGFFNPEKENYNEAYYTIPYKTGRINYFHGTKGHTEGYWHEMSRVNDKPVWHSAHAPSLDCPMLRITMNIKGRAHYPGNSLDPGDKHGIRLHEHALVKK
jgi:hypothetical protein